jgi:hypothetical protein
MSEVLLRSAIRTTLRKGASRRDIWVLISAYAAQGDNRKRKDGGVYRLPIELIPLERRVDFLEALIELPPPLGGAGDSGRAFRSEDPRSTAAAKVPSL